MKRQARRFLHLLLFFVLLATTVVGFSGRAWAGTTVAFSQLSTGDKVSFAGYQWIVLFAGDTFDPYPYLVTDGYYNPNGNSSPASYEFGSTNDFSGSSIESLLDGSSGGTGGFYGTLASSDQALIEHNPSHSWYISSTESVSDYIGLLSSDDFENSTYSSVLSVSPTQSYWTLTPADIQYIAPSDVYYMSSADGLLHYALPTTASYAIRPALYLNSDTISVSVPTITTPVYTGATSVSGTAAAGASVVLSVNGTAKAPVTANSTTGDWTVSGLSLSGGDTISVTVPPQSGAISKVVTATVQPATTTTTLTVSPAAATEPLGTQLTFTATVTGGSSPAGSVTFKDGGTTLGTATLSGTSPYKASYTTTTLAAGQDSITATYKGDADNASSTSSPVTLTVVAPPTFVSAATDTGGSKVKVTFSKPMNTTPPTGSAGFTVTVGSSPDTVNTVVYDSATGGYDLTLATQVQYYWQSVTLAYDSSGGVTSADTGILASFTAQAVTNNVPDNNATLSDLEYNGTQVPGFAKTTYTYDVTLTAGTATIPTVSATVYDGNATDQITQATALPGSATVVVTAPDGTTKLPYTINFTVAPPASSVPTNTGGGSTPALAITTISLPAGTVGQGYSQTISTNNEGAAPYTFTVTSGSLPTGLTLAASTGVISGTPTTAGTYNFTVTVKDANNNAASESYSLTVNSASGSASVSPSAGGTVALGSEASVTIPPGALEGSAPVNVTIQNAFSPPPAPPGYTVIGAFEFTVNGQDHYTFNSPVTLTFHFDTARVIKGTNPAVYYYDDSTNQWVNMGGTVSWTNDTVTITVNHFTEYAVMYQAPLSLSDIAGNWAQANIEKLVAMGVVTGYPDGTFRPNIDITRAEFTTMLVKTLKLTPKAGPVFADTEGTWTQSYISTAAAYGIVKGYDANHFGPNDLITREQMTAMVVRADKLALVSGPLPFTDTARIDPWARQYVQTAVKDGIIHGYPDGTFRPLAYATRAEAATVIAGLLK